MGLRKPDTNRIFSLMGIFLLLMTFGYSVMTKSQLDSIKVYAVATQEYSQYPGKLVKEFAGVQNKIFLLSSPLTANPEQAAERIFSHHQKKAALLEEAEKLDLSFDILKEYAKNLENLSNPDYFDKSISSIEKTGTHLDRLIESYNNKFDKALPGGLGSLVYQAMVRVGKRYLDQKRGNILKEYISRGKPLIKDITETSQGFLEEKVAEEWIKDIDQNLKSVHSSVRRQILLDTLSYPSNSFSIIELDTQIAEMYDDIYKVRKLNQSLITSLEELYLAHHTLHAHVQQKKKLTTILNEVVLFGSEVYEIRELYENLSPE